MGSVQHNKPIILYPVSGRGVVYSLSQKLPDMSRKIACQVSRQRSGLGHFPKYKKTRQISDVFFSFMC